MIAYECPHCGATLKVNEYDNFVKCEYCGSAVNLERESARNTSYGAKALAQRIREYRKKKSGIENAWRTYEQQDSNYSQVQKEGENLSANSVYFKFAGIWSVACLIAAGILRAIFSGHEGFGNFLAIVLAVFSGRYALNYAKAQKEKLIHAYEAKLNQARIQKENAYDAYSALSRDFDEDFLPDEVRNDDAINFIIKALETERAYNLNQAIGQWEDRSVSDNTSQLQFHRTLPSLPSLSPIVKTQTLKCPECGSTRIQVAKKGFRVGRAAAGLVLLGPVGLAAGAIGAKDLIHVCMDCNHKFE